MNDLEAVRLLADEPTDENVSRTRHKLTRLQSAPPRRSAPRWLIPAATAAAVAMVIAVGSTLMTPDNNRPMPNPAASQSPSPPDVAKVLEDLALKAEASAAPVELKQGQLIYVRTIYEGEWDKELPTTKDNKHFKSAEDWLEPQGFGVVGRLTDGKEGSHDYEVDRKYQRRRLAAHGPNWSDQTPEWLAKLPKDPQQLHASMLSAVDKKSPFREYYPLGAVARIFRHASPVLSPELKGALVRTLKLVPNLQVGEVIINGQKLISIGHEDQTELVRRTGIYFDPATGDVVGIGSITEGVGSRTPAPGATGDPTKRTMEAWYFQRQLWTVTVVNKKGERSGA